MRNLQHTNLVGLEEAERIATNNKHSTIISEVMIVMPFYCVCMYICDSCLGGGGGGLTS